MEVTHFEALYPPDARAGELEKMIGYVKEGNSCQVIGAPGVGRANLFRFLAHNKQIRLRHLGEGEKQYHFVLADFTEIRERSLFDVTKFLFLTLADSLRDRGLKEENAKVYGLFKEGLALQDELVLFQRLKEAIDYLALEKEYRLVFLFERFEDYIPMVGSGFFVNLQTLRNRAKFRFSIVFSLNRPLEQMIDPSGYPDIYRLLAGHTIYLTIYDEPSVTFRVAYLEKSLGKYLKDEQRQAMLSMTGGHGKMTKVCAEELLRQTEPSENIHDFLMNDRIVRNVSYEIWEALQPDEHAVLRKIVTGKLMEPLTETEQSAVAYLQSVNLLQDLAFTIPIFEAFVRYRADHALDERIQYIESKDEIRKGDALLSDKLTKAEFRLLRYLLLKPDQVVERDAVVSAVWQESKSTAGITDQAIDQLLFRLRRKIEDDPNNPTHLQTVKGRGVIFTP